MDVAWKVKTCEQTCNSTGDGACSQQGAQSAGVPEIIGVVEGQEPVHAWIQTTYPNILGKSNKNIPTVHYNTCQNCMYVPGLQKHPMLDIALHSSRISPCTGVELTPT